MVSEPDFSKSGGDDAERANTGRAQTLMRPDLPGEAGHRRFAVGSGDRGDLARLGAEEPRRHERKAPPRIGVLDEGDVLGFDAPTTKGFGNIEGFGNEHGGDTAGQRVGDEIAAVGAAAGESGEKVSRLGLARIESEPRDFDVLGCRASAHLPLLHGHGVAVHQINKTQACAPGHRHRSPSGPEFPARPHRSAKRRRQAPCVQ